jgi:biopolymer transport protein ExbB/TolQ
MKNLLIVAITFFTLNTVAQEKKITVKQDQSEALANIETKKLTKQLDLSAKQENKVYAVMLQHFQEKTQSKQKIKQMVASKNSKENKTKVKKAITKYKQDYSEKLNSQLKKILSEQQYMTYLENQKTKQKIMVKKN